MKKQLLLPMLAVMFLPVLAMAAAPDFSGAWLRDSANSDPAPTNTTYWITAGRGGAPAGPANAAGGARGGAAAAGPGAGAGGGRGFGPQQVILTVHEDAKSLQVVSQGVTSEYALDGKPHPVPMATGIEKATITASLQGDTLVIDTSEPYGGMPGNATLRVRDVWSVSSDGNTLTITTTRDVPAEKQTYKQVYTRTQAQSDSICSAGCITPAGR